MRLITIFIITLFLASCSSELIDTQESENQITEVILDNNQKLRIVSQNVTKETIESFVSQLSSQLQEAVQTDIPQASFKSNDIKFLPFNWLKGSYYWANTAKEDITYQTYNVSYQNVKYQDHVMLISVVRAIDKENPVIPFFKWQYNANFGVGWKMTCVRAQLIGPDEKVSKTNIIIEEEVRILNKHMTCVFLPEPVLTLGWGYGG